LPKAAVQVVLPSEAKALGGLPHVKVQQQQAMVGQRLFSAKFIGMEMASLKTMLRLPAGGK
jgi:hypothetical protein